VYQKRVHNSLVTVWKDLEHRVVDTAIDQYSVSVQKADFLNRPAITIGKKTTHLAQRLQRLILAVE